MALSLCVWAIKNGFPHIHGGYGVHRLPNSVPLSYKAFSSKSTVELQGLWVYSILFLISGSTSDFSFSLLGYQRSSIPFHHHIKHWVRGKVSPVRPIFWFKFVLSPVYFLKPFCRTSVYLTDDRTKLRNELTIFNPHGLEIDRTNLGWKGPIAN